MNRQEAIKAVTAATHSLVGSPAAEAAVDVLWPEIERLRDLLTQADHVIIWENHFDLPRDFQEQVEGAIKER